MQYIEEITAGIVALATIITTSLAVAYRIKKGVDAIIDDDAETKKPEMFTDKERQDIANQLTEIKQAMDRIRSDMDAKEKVMDIQISYLKKDVDVLFEKTDKLTDILIEHFSK
jgi:hypothetical protein